MLAVGVEHDVQQGLAQPAGEVARPGKSTHTDDDGWTEYGRKNSNMAATIGGLSVVAIGLGVYLYQAPIDDKKEGSAKPVRLSPPPRDRLHA